MDDKQWEGGVHNEIWKTRVDIGMTQVVSAIELTNKKLDRMTELLTDYREEAVRHSEKLGKIEKIEESLNTHLRDYEKNKGKWSVWVIILALIVSGVFGMFFHVMKSSANNTQVIRKR